MRHNLNKAIFPPSVALRAFCNARGVSIGQVVNRDKHHVFVKMRAILAKDMRNAGYSYPEIGQAMGLHHTSIMSMFKKKNLS